MKSNTSRVFHAFYSTSTGLVFLLATVIVTGCASRSPAPVVDRGGGPIVAPPTPPAPLPQAQRPADARPEYHEVQKGETLFSIAFQHGVEYKDLAQWNGLENPNLLRIGQRLRLTAPDGAPVATPMTQGAGIVVTPLGGDQSSPKPASPPVSGEQPSAKPATPPVSANQPPTRPATAAVPAGPLKSEPKAVKQPYSDKALAQFQSVPGADQVKSEAKAEAKPGEAKPATPGEDDIDWIWPTRGKPKVLFTETSKGIDIPGTRGQPVTAAAGGKVIHVGSNLRGYGKLVIIQHSSMFLSAYAHNNQVLVKEGERVTKGQKIAEMGDTDTDQVKLHFEIRRFGKPVDPLKYLRGEKAS